MASAQQQRRLPSVAKSGWLYRQSSIMKKWRRYFFSLSTEGYLRYFETEYSTKAEGAICVPTECIAVKLGPEVGNVTAPENLPVQFLLSVETINGSKCIMCGESLDDTKAWELAIKEARMIRHNVRSNSAPPPGCVAYGSGVAQPVVLGGTSTRYYVYPSTQTVTTYTRGYPYSYGYPNQVIYIPHDSTVIYDRGPCYNSCAYPALGLGTGLLAGAALGSLMWHPFMFWC